MSKQSVIHFDKDAVYHQSFNSAEDVARTSTIIGTPVFSNGKVTMDGSTDYINLDTVFNNDLARTTTGTMHMRVTPATDGDLFFAFGDTNGDTFLRPTMLVGGEIRFTCRNAGSTRWNLDTTDASLVVGTTYDITFVMDGTAIKIYLDGVALTLNFTTSTDKTVWIGGMAALDNFNLGTLIYNSGAAQGLWTGDMDSFTIYDRALSATEVASLYANSLYTPPSIANEVFRLDTRDGVIEDKWDNAIVNTSVVLSKDMPGECADFNGAALLNIDSVLTASLASTTTGTWIAWIKLADSSPASANYIINFGDTNADERLGFYIETTGILTAAYKVGGVNKWGVDLDSATFANEEWAHVAITQNATEPVLYLNGVAEAQAFFVTTDKTAWIAAGTGLDNGRIGDRNWNSGGEVGHLNGKIPMVKLYDTNLSATQIERDYNSTKSTFNK